MIFRLRHLPALFLTLSAGLASAQTAASLATSGNWSAAANWNPAVVPNNAGPTLYNVTVAGGRTATLDVNVGIQDLSMTGLVSPGTNSTVVLNPGMTLTVNHSFSAGLYTQINGGGTLTLNAGAGASSGTGGNAAMFLDNVTFNNQAGSVFSDQAANTAFSTTLGHGTVINNAGTYGLDSGGSGLYPTTGGGSFVNSGTFRGSGTVQVPFTNTGAITGLGQLFFSASGTSSGTLNTGTVAGQTVTFDTGTWNFTNASTNSGAGTFRVAGTAAVTINGAHNVTGSTQVGSGSLTFPNANTTLGGILYLYGGATNLTGANTVARFDLGNPGFATGSPVAVLNLGANGALTVNGAFNTGTYSQANGTGTASITTTGGGSIGSNSALILNGVTLNNAVGSTLTESNGGGFDNTLQNGAVINNAGTWVLQNQNGRGLVAAAGLAGVGVAFNNTGTLTGNASFTSANIAFALNNTGIVRLDAGLGGGGNPTLAVGTFTQTAGSTQLGHDNGNSATISSANPIRFQAGLLQGSGQLQGSVIVTGANTLVSPGYSIGQLNVQGTYQQTGGMLALEIGRTAAGAGGTTRDVLTSTGALNLTGTALTFSLLPGSLPLQLGDAFTVLTSATNALTLAGDSFTFDASLAGYTIAQAQTAGSYTLTIIVPEPTTFAMLAASALGLLGVRRRKSSR